MAISKFDIANELLTSLPRKYPGDYSKGTSNDGRFVTIQGYCKQKDLYFVIQIHDESEIYASLVFKIQQSNRFEFADYMERFNAKTKSYPYAYLTYHNVSDGFFVNLCKQVDDKCYTPYGFAQAAIKALDDLIYCSSCQEARKRIESLR